MAPQSSTYVAHSRSVIPDLMLALRIRRLIGRKSEWRLFEAEHSHRSGTQLAHCNGQYSAFSSGEGVAASGLPTIRPSLDSMSEAVVHVRPAILVY